MPWGPLVSYFLQPFLYTGGSKETGFCSNLSSHEFQMFKTFAGSLLLIPSHEELQSGGTDSWRSQAGSAMPVTKEPTFSLQVAAIQAARCSN